MLGRDVVTVLARPVVDPDVALWAEAVKANGGGMPSDARKALLSAFVTALKPAPWSILDDLVVFAGETRIQALTSLKRRLLYSEVNGPITFTADRGFTGSAGRYISSGINPSTAGGNYQLNNAAGFGFGLTAAGTEGVIIGQSFPGDSTGLLELWPYRTNASMIGRITCPVMYVLASPPPNSGVGLSTIARISAPTMVMRRNGVQVGSANVGSDIVTNGVITFLGNANTQSYSGGTIALGGFGGYLDPAKDLALYNASQTLLHAIGAV